MNLGPTGYEPVALTTELWARSQTNNIKYEKTKGKDVLTGYYCTMCFFCFLLKSGVEFMKEKK